MNTRRAKSIRELKPRERAKTLPSLLPPLPPEMHRALVNAVVDLLLADLKRNPPRV